MIYFDKKVNYVDLKPKQKEIYNFQKVSARLADYGYTTIKLDDDWMGADFLALHFDGFRYLKIQLKGRLTFNKKYIGQNIFICFFEKEWFIYPHDELLKKFEAEISNSISWSRTGIYHYPYLTSNRLQMLQEFTLS